MRYFIVISLILIIVGGVALIYFTALHFLPKTPPREISLEVEKEEIGEAAVVTKKEYPAPDFELLNVRGETVKLKTFKNKIIVLTFWTSWNPAAQDQVVILENYFQEIKSSQDIVLLTINNMEDKSIVLNFIRRGEYSLPVLLDEEGKVGELYGITTLPATFFINKDGKIKEIYIGVLNKEEIKDRVGKLYQ